VRGCLAAHSLAQGTETAISRCVTANWTSPPDNYDTRNSAGVICSRGRYRRTDVAAYVLTGRASTCPGIARPHSVPAPMDGCWAVHSLFSVARACMHELYVRRVRTVVGVVPYSFTVRQANHFVTNRRLYIWYVLLCGPWLRTYLKLAALSEYCHLADGPQPLDVTIPPSRRPLISHHIYAPGLRDAHTCSALHALCAALA
jgi:hypothetical protein